MVILYLVVRESHSFYVHVYIFMQLFYERVFFAHDPFFAHKIFLIKSVFPGRCANSGSESKGTFQVSHHHQMQYSHIPKAPFWGSYLPAGRYYQCILSFTDRVTQRIKISITDNVRLLDVSILLCSSVFF